MSYDELPIRITTGYWESEAALRNYYLMFANEAMAEGRARVGRPPMSPGDRLLINSRRQYVIARKAERSAQ